jgi:hypothetical protein
LPLEHTNVERDLVIDVYEAYQFLSGIVNDTYAVVFESTNELRKGFGVYASPDEYDDCCGMTVTEYSTCEYSNESMIPIWYCWDVESLCEEAELFKSITYECEMGINHDTLKHHWYTYEWRYNHIVRLRKLLDSQPLPVHRWL